MKTGKLTNQEKYTILGMDALDKFSTEDIAAFLKRSVKVVEKYLAEVKEVAPEPEVVELPKEVEQPQKPTLKTTVKSMFQKVLGGKATVVQMTKGASEASDEDVKRGPVSRKIRECIHKTKSDE